MVAYRVSRKNQTVPLGAAVYARPLDEQELDALVDHLQETHGGDLMIELVDEAALQRHIDAGYEVWRSL